MRLKNKVAIITGSSRGIGKATALLFAKEGAKVVVNYISSKNKAIEVVNKIKKMGSEAIAIKCDVSKENEVKNMINKTIKTYGKIDILVNNAGIVYDVPLFQRKTEQFKRTLEVNLLGNFLCSKYVAKEMLKTKYGKIINISSTNAINCFSSDSIDYDASKAGIITLTKNFAKALAPNIQVNTVAPGWVNTDMNKKLSKKIIKEEIEKIYLKRFAEPEDIAKTILFLASEDSNYITGSTIIIDGGSS
jgi:3-oxoacyl-[acyl-carrier protein] reductase